MSYSFFNSEQITPLFVCIPFYIASLLLFKKSRITSLSLLFFGAIGIGYFIANLDPFLILWDEQYHALVAKNMDKNPFKPVLIEKPIFGYDYKNWTANHIWLHKQPLFLWQMALSIKLFGLSHLSIRLPSIIMHAILPIFIYRIGKITVNENVGYYAAFLFAVAYFPLELVAGRFSTDHNDVAFLFYVTASFWSWFEYKKSNKKYWLILIGIFSGCSVLIKWLLGLIVHVTWFISIISKRETLIKVKSYYPILFSGIISCLIFIPWQFFILTAYPKEAKYEFHLNSQHFITTVEGHHETIWFHFTKGFRELYGSGFLIPIIIILGIVLFIKRVEHRSYRMVIISLILFTYIFFTIAATKMIAFTLIVFPFAYLGLGSLIDYVVSFIKERASIIIFYPLRIVLLVLIGLVCLNLDKIENKHTFWKPLDNHNRLGELTEMKLIETINSKYNNKHVIFNANVTLNGHIPIMFYTDCIAYNFIPSKEQIKTARNCGKKIVVVDLGSLPNYIIEDKSILILKIEKFKIPL